MNQKLTTVPTGTAVPFHTAVPDHTKSANSTSQKDNVFYSPAVEALIAHRKLIFDFACERSQKRILRTKRIRASEELQGEEDRNAAAAYLHCRDLSLNASQFADERPLTAVGVSTEGNIVASGSLGTNVRLWCMSSMQALGTLKGHEERVTAVAWHPQAYSTSGASILASSSADGSCILWDCRNSVSDGYASSQAMECGDGSETRATKEVLHVLKGHHGVISDCAFHPNGRIVGTTGHDYTWRLWDVERGEELLLQDGHIKEVGAIAFQEDGALVLTADWAGAVLRILVKCIYLY